jgi:hypothetical protein
MAEACEDGGGGLRAPALQARIAVGRITDEGEIVGDRGRRNAELLDDARLVAQLVPSPIELHDSRAAHRLREILVRRADRHALHPRIECSARGPGCQRIVRLVLDHGPHGNAEGTQRLFERDELGEQVSRNAGARLVSAPEPVAERLDHVIGGHGEVRDTAVDQSQDRPDHSADRCDFLPVTVVR